jgi:hypothetical protein
LKMPRNSRIPYFLHHGIQKMGFCVGLYMWAWDLVGRAHEEWTSRPLLARDLVVSPVPVFRSAICDCLSLNVFGLSLVVWAWDLVVIRLLCCGLPAPTRRQFFALRFLTVWMFLSYLRISQSCCSLHA